MSDKPYHLIAADRCGPFREAYFATFAEVLQARDEWHAELGKSEHAFAAFNIDRCDYDTNGLTEDEEL